ncbi:MAG: phosphatase PAP2 family protein [Candidatus Saccharimonadales bacterium]
MQYDLLIRLLADASLVPIVLLGAWALVFKIPKGHRYEAYTRIVMAGLTAYLVAKLIGMVYQPGDARPFELLGVAAGASSLNNPGFPSDHALFATAILLAVWFETRLRVVTIIMTACLVLMGLGRVLALVHTPLDVIGGVVIACVGILWYIQSPAYSTHSRTVPLQK